MVQRFVSKTLNSKTLEKSNYPRVGESYIKLSSILPRLASNSDSFTLAPQVAGIMGVCHHTQIIMVHLYDQIFTTIKDLRFI
jgi:hypothetical protein